MNWILQIEYSASSKCLTSELMIFRQGINIPNNSDLLSEGINIYLTEGSSGHNWIWVERNVYEA